MGQLIINTNLSKILNNASSDENFNLNCEKNIDEYENNSNINIETNKTKRSAITQIQNTNNTRKYMNGQRKDISAN